MYVYSDPYFNADLFSSTTVKLVSSGLISQYPNNLGPVGSLFSIPLTHVNRQQLRDMSNVNFILQFPDDGQVRPQNQSFYITTKNNVAMVQTGHSDGEATKDEQKILANLIFYCNQLITNSTENIDREAVDATPPSSPSILLTPTGYQFSSTDRGTKYYYYAECYDKNDLSTPSQITPVHSVSIITEFSHYLYVCDNQPDTNVRAELYKICSPLYIC